MPRRARYAFRLGRPKRRAGLDEMHRRGKAGFRHRPQRIRGERTAAGAQLDPGDVGPPGAVPQIGAPQPDQFAEHLADLGRRGEVARRPQRIARRIIMRVGGRHELGDRDRPRQRYRAGEPIGERRGIDGLRRRFRSRRSAPRAGGALPRSRSDRRRRRSSARSATGPCAGRSRGRIRRAANRARGRIPP